MNVTTVPIRYLPIAPPPTQENNYSQRERPLSFQHRFFEVNTQPLNNYGYPEPGIQVQDNSMPIDHHH
jgi:hypothetical protein